MQPVLELITRYADNAHGDQRRKYTSDRYIVHPIRVMELCAAHTSSLPVLAAALLHDVLEDTPVQKEEMHAFLSQHLSAHDAAATIALVTELTDEYTKQAYPQWNRKRRKQAERDRSAQTSADAQTIKYADIIDNCREIVHHDLQFATVFLRECGYLLSEMDKGNADLRQQAREVIEEGSAILKAARAAKESKS